MEIGLLDKVGQCIKEIPAIHVDVTGLQIHWFSVRVVVPLPRKHLLNLSLAGVLLYTEECIMGYFGVF